MNMVQEISRMFEDANIAELAHEWEIIVYDIPEFEAVGDEAIDIEFETASLEAEELI